MLKKLFFVAIFSLIFTLFAGQRVEAATAPLSGFAWSSNIGWIQFNPSRGPGVSIDTATGVFSGFAWSSNIGWIDFNGTRLDGTNFARAIAPNPDGSSGWDGKIKLRGSVQGGGSYGVQVSSNGENLQGFAWGSDVVGWIKFCDSDYCVNIGGLIASCSVNPAVAASGPVDALWHLSLLGGTGPYVYSWNITGPSTYNSGPSQPVNTIVDYPTEGLSDPGTYTGIASVTDQATGRSATCGTPAVLTIGGSTPVTQPSVSAVNGFDRMEISSQPLTSPAVSSFAKYRANAGGESGVTMKIVSIISLTNGTDLTGNSGVTCRLASTRATGDNGFGNCLGIALPINNVFDQEFFLNLRVNRPTQTIKDGNPYRVKVELSPCSGPTCTDEQTIFDYRVGTVNPI